MSTKHAEAAGKFLENKTLASWHDETLWMVRAKRDKMGKAVPEWELLRDMASAIKMYSNSHLESSRRMLWQTALRCIGLRMPRSIAPSFTIF